MKEKIRTIYEIQQKLNELRGQNDMNENKDSGWSSDVAVKLRAQIEILSWVLRLEETETGERN